MMSDGVVVGYDRSGSGDRTLAEAAAAAVRSGQALVVVNAYPGPIPHGATLPLPDTAEWAPTDLVDSANLLVGHAITLVRSWHPRLPVEGRVVAGRVWEVLGEASRHAGLLVVGNPGGTVDTLPGSVTLRVLAEAACPVLVVPAGDEDGEDGEDGEDRRRADGAAVVAAVVAAVDVEDPCDDVLDFAFAEAARRNAALEVVHVWEQPRNVNHLRHTTGPGHDATLIEQQHQIRLTELVDAAAGRHPGVEAAARVEIGPPGRALVTATESAGLLVVGARRQGKGHHHRLSIGPVVHALLHHGECPMAVVPNGPAPE
ncbi:nucleotide-binding universal stress UspA family protein [Catenulispora sp. GP43]|uniref:universal stress protein n=1 Tax=Catenulispora sp. GP43 TaxID=3156263 RepID=UPI00351113F1